MARDEQAKEIERLAAEVDALGPYLDLAREIRREVERFAADADADVDTFAAALDAIPARERADLARAVFDRLAPERQWEVLARLFGDVELREALERARDERLSSLRRAVARRDVLAAAVAEGRLGTDGLPEGTRLELGLFRPEDVQAGIGKGPDSDVCARLLVLRANGPGGTFRVIDDVFNPRGGLFMSAAYDGSVWRREQLSSHAVVRVGSLVAGGEALEPALYLGARVDVEAGGELREGRLHLGYALVDDLDPFAAAS